MKKSLKKVSMEGTLLLLDQNVEMAWSQVFINYHFGLQNLEKDEHGPNGNKLFTIVHKKAAPRHIPNQVI